MKEFNQVTSWFYTSCACQECCAMSSRHCILYILSRKAKGKETVYDYTITKISIKLCRGQQNIDVLVDKVHLTKNFAFLNVIKSVILKIKSKSSVHIVIKYWEKRITWWQSRDPARKQNMYMHKYSNPDILLKKRHHKLIKHDSSKGKDLLAFMHLLQVYDSR